MSGGTVARSPSVFSTGHATIRWEAIGAVATILGLVLTALQLYVPHPPSLLIIVLAAILILRPPCSSLSA